MVVVMEQADAVVGVEVGVVGHKQRMAESHTARQGMTGKIDLVW